MKIPLIAVFALLTGFSGWIGYEQGRRRPVTFWMTNATSETAFGWDKGNKCVATWTRGTNYYIWSPLRLEKDMR